MSETTLTATQLAVQLGNAPKAPETIYLSEDPEDNKLTLAVTPSADTTFTEAEPVLKAEASKASGSLLYLDLRGLRLSAKELEALTVTGKGWAFLVDPAGYLCLAPEETVTRKAETPLELKIEGLSISKPPTGGSVQLYLVLFRVSGVTTGNTGLPWAFKSLLAPPPSGEANLHDAIALTIPQIDVVAAGGKYAGYANSLSFVLAPGDKPLNVKAGPETKFQLTFVYAAPEDPEGYGALCTTAQALKTKVKPGQNAQGWHVTPPKDEQNPTWTLQPPEGKPIVTAQGVVNFLINELETQLRPGPTLMILSYSGVPGYESGAYVRVLEKVGHATIDSFEITPNPVVLKDGSATVTLKWKTSNATAVSVSGYGVVEGESVEIEILETTPFTLQAEGPPNSRNSAIETKTATVLPVINSFEADPEAVYQKDFPGNVDLSWNVATKGKVKLVSSTGSKDPHEYGPVDSVSLQVAAPQMITLVPVSGESDPLIRRSVVISAFEPQLSQPGLSQAPSCVAASPTGAFVAVGSQSGVTALDTMTYQPIGQQIAALQGANDLAFSADGSMLYVACAGKAVAPIAVKGTGAVPQYEFANLGNVALAAEPRGIAVAPSGKYVYVSTADGNLVVLKVEANGTLGQFATVPVGAGPEGVGVLPTGARVYVANSGDNSVTVIGVSESGKHEAVRTIKKLPSEPTGVVTTADAKVLLIACRGASEVAARSVEFPDALGKGLSVGTGACDVALVPGGRYALVANKGASTVSLLSLGETPGTCSVLSSGIATGKGPVGVAVTPEAGLALVATGGESALSVLTLARYTELQEPVKAGAQVSDVEVDPSGKRAVTWHDARQTFSQSQPSKGVFVYDLSSLQVTAQLAGQPIIDFVFHPIIGSNRAFAITTDSAIIEVVDTSAWRPSGQFNLVSLTKGSSRALAVSANGSTLFALVSTPEGAFELIGLTIAEDGSLAPIGKAVRAFTTTNPTFGGLAASPDGSRAYVLDGAGGNLWIVAREGQGFSVASKPVVVGAGGVAMALSPDGADLFVLIRTGLVNTLASVATAELTTKTLVLDSIEYSSLRGVTVSPDNSTVFATDGKTAGTRAFDAASLRLLQTISSKNRVLNPIGIAVSPDGSRLFTANVNSNNMSVIQQVQPTPEGRATEGGK
ncbi:MAG TPA: YncE family protein [Solirubrobacterales bacterium]|nr:YncE family protein [Solirubrobacterales bacterium]